MSGTAFRDIARAIREVSGLVLEPGQSYLLDARMGPLLRRHGLADLQALAQRLHSPGGALLAREAAEAATTNETSFFRDDLPFRHLTSMLPRLAAARGGAPLRVWSAACSSGQEAYTVAMAARLAPGAPRVEILGTDISAAMVERARAGLYTAFEARRGLTPALLDRFFTPEELSWRVKPGLQEDCRFAVANLTAPLDISGVFDVVLLRNLLIYLDTPNKELVIEACARRMVPGGLLYLGAAETLLGLRTRFTPTPDYRGCYRLEGAACPA